MANQKNLSNTTPAAAAGGQNVLWQSDASSPTNVSAYINFASVLVPINLSGSNALTFGGTTSSQVGLFPSGTTLGIRLGDNSADAPITASALTLSGSTTSNSYPLNITTKNNGATNVSGAVLILQNASGTTPSYIIKDNSDNLLIRTDSLSISASPFIQIQSSANLVFSIPNCGTFTFYQGGSNFGGGSGQAVLDMFQTGSTPHGLYIKCHSNPQSVFLSVDDGSITTTNQSAQQFVLTQVTVSGGSTTYTGTIGIGGSNALVGKTIVFAGFSTGGNNVTAVVTGSTLTTIVVATTSQVNETHAGTATVNYNASVISMNGSYWNSSAQVDNWSILGTVGTGAGANPSSQLIISHTGSGSTNVGVVVPTLVVGAATPTGTSGQVSFGNSTGFGNGSSGTAVTTTTKSTGSGPATPQTVVNYLEIDIAGTKYWLPLVQ